MTRMSVFNSPFLLGFDQLERVLDRVAKSASDGYPPYNIEHAGDDALRITLAVAGFRRDDLEITVAESQLTIRGRQSDSDGRVYLHRGIAARQFQRSFVLAEGIEVVGAELPTVCSMSIWSGPRPRAAKGRSRSARPTTARPRTRRVCPFRLEAQRLVRPLRVPRYGAGAPTRDEGFLSLKSTISSPE